MMKLEPRTEQRKCLVEMIDIMRSMLPDESRLILCQFGGDPNEVDEITKWRPKVWNTDLLQENWNIYLCVSAMGRGGIDGRFRRSKECYQGGLGFMIDDIGDGGGAKMPLALLDRLEPSAVIETSPRNYQALYLFDALVEKMDVHEALIANFIATHCPSGTDTGMAGVNRVFRPGIGINGKGSYKDANGEPWKVRFVHWNANARYSPEDIAAAFGVTLKPPPRRFRSNRKVGERDGRVEFFNRVVALCLRNGIIKKARSRTFNRAGWAEVVCPWIDNHSKNADTGAAIRWPDEENDYNGAFRCHHGHCKDKSWGDFVNALADQIDRDDDELLASNASAPDLESV